MTAVAFLSRARAWFADYGITHIERIVTDNGACYKAQRSHRRLWAHVIRGSRRTPRHNGKIERYTRIIAEEFLYARTWTSEEQRHEALGLWNLHYNYHRPHGAAGGQPPASLTPARVNNVSASYI